MDAINFVTKHAQERYRERFPERIPQNRHIVGHILDEVKAAKVDRAFLNDSNRIVWLIEKYGDFNHNVLVNDAVVFIVRDDRVITVIDRNDRGMQRMVGPATTSRFRKR